MHQKVENYSFKYVNPSYNTQEKNVNNTLLKKMMYKYLQLQ